MVQVKPIKTLGAGSGVGVKATAGLVPTADMSFSVDMGKGLREPCDPFRTAPVFSAELNSPDANNWNCLPEVMVPTRLFDLSSVTSYHELVVAIIWMHNLPAGQSYTVTHRWYRGVDNQFMFGYGYFIADPGDYGYNLWEWAYVYSYVGYVPWEIWDNGAYYTIITVERGLQSYSYRLDYVIEGLRRELVEGRPYSVNVKVINQSTSVGGVPAEATLSVGLLANTKFETLFQPQVVSEHFSQNQERVFQYIMGVPTEVASQEGSISAWVVSPKDETVASVVRGILIKREVLVLSISYFDNVWYSFIPEVTNSVTANNNNVWVSVGLALCVVNKTYYLVVITPRQTFSTSVVATKTSPVVQLQVPTGVAGTEIWTIQLYDAYDNYMFWEHSYEMIVEVK